MDSREKGRDEGSGWDDQKEEEESKYSVIGLDRGNSVLLPELGSGSDDSRRKPGTKKYKWWWSFSWLLIWNWWWLKRHEWIEKTASLSSLSSLPDVTELSVKLSSMHLHDVFFFMFCTSASAKAKRTILVSYRSRSESKRLTLFHRQQEAE